MSVYVVEAIQDENGNGRGGKPGDQGDGRKAEIVVRAYSKRSYKWNAVLRAKDRNIALTAAEIATRIANAPNFGYNKDARWAGAKSIEAVGVDHLEDSVYGDFDCSSLCIEAYRLAGVPLKMTGYTGSMIKLMMATGYFEEFTDAKHLDSVDYAMIGDVYVAEGIHALMIITDGSKVDPEPEPDPETGDYVAIIKGSVFVRKAPAGRAIEVGHKGDEYPYLGYTEADKTGKLWWAVDCYRKEMIGFISSANTKHAVLVTESEE